MKRQGQPFHRDAGSVLGETVPGVLTQNLGSNRFEALAMWGYSPCALGNVSHDENNDSHCYDCFDSSLAILSTLRVSAHLIFSMKGMPFLSPLRGEETKAK